MTVAVALTRRGLRLTGRGRAEAIAITPPPPGPASALVTHQGDVLIDADGAVLIWENG